MKVIYSLYFPVFFFNPFGVIAPVETNDSYKSSAATSEINANNEVIKLTESELQITQEEFAEWEDLMGEESSAPVHMDVVDYELPQGKVFYIKDYSIRELTYFNDS